jgi:hypothetical protein
MFTLQAYVSTIELFTVRLPGVTARSGRELGGAASMRRCADVLRALA